MITNKRSQELLMLATTGKPLNKDATEEEKKYKKNTNMTIKLCTKLPKNMA